MVKAPCFQCRDTDWISSREIKIPYVTWCNQKKKKKSHSEELDSVLKREASGTHHSPFSNLETSLVQGYSRKNRFSPVTANCSSIPTPDSESWTDYILILEAEEKNIFKKTTGIC